MVVFPAGTVVYCLVSSELHDIDTVMAHNAPTSIKFADRALELARAGRPLANIPPFLVQWMVVGTSSPLISDLNIRMWNGREYGGYVIRQDVRDPVPVLRALRLDQYRLIVAGDRTTSTVTNGQPVDRQIYYYVYDISPVTRGNGPLYLYVIFDRSKDMRYLGSHMLRQGGGLSRAPVSRASSEAFRDRLLEDAVAHVYGAPEHRQQAILQLMAKDLPADFYAEVVARLHDLADVSSMERHS